MGMNWRRLVLVVLVAAIVGGASGFIGHQVSARMERIEVARQQVEIDRYLKCLDYKEHPDRNYIRRPCIPPAP